MEEILHHLGCTKNLVNGIFTISTGDFAGFFEPKTERTPSKPKQKLQDCLCDSSPFQNGFAHRGAAEASTWLCAEYGESLKYLEETSLIGQVISLKIWKISCWVGLTYHWIWRKHTKAPLCFFFQKKSFLLWMGQMSTCSSSLSSWNFSICWSFPSKNGQEKGYEVVLVGHSLGAAVAAACCVQLRTSGLAARCVCYAPPATVDQRSAREAANYITSVVHDDDVIPRMSILSLLELYKVLVCINFLGRVGRGGGFWSFLWVVEMNDVCYKTLVAFRNLFQPSLTVHFFTSWMSPLTRWFYPITGYLQPRHWLRRSAVIRRQLGCWRWGIAHLAPWRLNWR